MLSTSCIHIYIVHGPSLKVYLLMGYAPGTFNVPVLDLQLRQGDDRDMVARRDVSNGFRCSGILFEDSVMFYILI